MIEENQVGRSPSGPGSQASPGAAEASPPSVSIPNALAIADDLIALAEYAYEENASRLDALIEDAVCDVEDGVCNWDVCRGTGCVIDKYHRGLALQTACAAQAIEARRAATGTGAVHESAVGSADAPKAVS